MEKALELSRYCVPFTPFKRKLEEAVVCLVSTAGVRAKPDAPFNVEGDNSFRRIDASLSAAGTVPAWLHRRAQRGTPRGRVAAEMDCDGRAGASTRRPQAGRSHHARLHLRPSRANQRGRYRCRPGLHGLARIRGWRGAPW